MGKKVKHAGIIPSGIVVSVMKKLFFVRHGQTDMNVLEQFAGLTDAKLTEEGKEQARAAGAVIHEKHPKIDLIICSPLSRAHNTAKLIAEQIDYPADKIVTDDRFVERNFGDQEGKSAPDFIKVHHYKEMDKVNGAETFEAMHERAAEALQYLKTRPENVILVVSHGSFGRAFRLVVEERPHHHEYTHEVARIGNCEILELI